MSELVLKGAKSEYDVRVAQALGGALVLESDKLESGIVLTQPNLLLRFSDVSLKAGDLASQLSASSPVLPFKKKFSISEEDSSYFIIAFGQDIKIDTDMQSELSLRLDGFRQSLGDSVVFSSELLNDKLGYHYSVFDDALVLRFSGAMPKALLASFISSFILAVSNENSRELRVSAIIDKKAIFSKIYHSFERGAQI